MAAKRTFSASLIQMCSTPSASESMNQAEKLFEKSLKDSPDLVCFPETFAFLAEGREAILQQAGTLAGEQVRRVRNWAKKSRTWIHAGSLLIKPDKKSKRVTNTSLLINPRGEIVSRYDKIHLFDVRAGNRNYFESKTVKAGTRVTIAKTPWGKMGMSVCYDLRFPELYRRYSEKGASLIMAPAAFTSATGKAHWDCLTRARAIENQCFLIAATQCGTHYSGRETHGHSRVVDPWGKLIGEKKKGVGVLSVKIDLSRVEKIRRRFSALKHRRLK